MAKSSNVVGIADQLLERSPAEAYISQQIGIPVELVKLERHAHSKDGPPFRLWGSRALYRKTDLLEWAHKRLREPAAPSDRARA